MSIVINVLSREHSWIASDGLQKNAGTGEIVSETLQKYEVLNPKLCIGYTGHYEVARRVVDYVKTLCPDIEHANVELAADFAKQIVDCAVQQIGMIDAQFVVTGVTSNNQMASFIVRPSAPVQKIQSLNGTPQFVILHNNLKDDLGSLIRADKNGRYSDTAVLTGMKELIHRTARVSLSTMLCFIIESTCEMAKCHVKTFLGKARLIGQVVKANAVCNAFDLNRGFILGLGCDGGVKCGESFFVGHEGYLL